MHVIQTSNERTSGLVQVRETTLLSIKLTITDIWKISEFILFDPANLPTNQV